MEKNFPYFKLRKEEEKRFIYCGYKYRNREIKIFSKMYFYLFLYPFLKVKRIKNSGSLKILKFDVWEESSLRESRIRHLPFLIQSIFNPEEIYFVDIDKELLRMARKNIRFFGFRRAYIINGDIRNLPFPNEKFDVVIDFSTTDHLPLIDLKKSMREVYRVLKENGVYLIYHLNSEYFNIRRWNYRYTSRGVDNMRLPSFPRAKKRIESLLNKNGFFIHEKGYVFPFYFDKSLIVYWRFLFNNFHEFLPPHFLFSFFNFPTLNLFFYIVAIKKEEGKFTRVRGGYK